MDDKNNALAVFVYRLLCDNNFQSVAVGVSPFMSRGTGSGCVKGDGSADTLNETYIKKGLKHG